MFNYTRSSHIVKHFFHQDDGFYKPKFLGKIRQIGVFSERSASNGRASEEKRRDGGF